VIEEGEEEEGMMKVVDALLVNNILPSLSFLIDTLLGLTSQLLYYMVVVDDDDNNSGLHYIPSLPDTSTIISKLVLLLLHNIIMYTEDSETSSE